MGHCVLLLAHMGTTVNMEVSISIVIKIGFACPDFSFAGWDFLYF